MNFTGMILFLYFIFSRMILICLAKGMDYSGAIATPSKGDRVFFKKVNMNYFIC